MVKTTVYLDNEVALSLRTIAERTGKPQAELVREALRKYTSSQKPPLPAGMGRFDSGRTDVSQNYRKMLKKAVREGRWP
jgi:predicted transcriptional regulator